MTRTRTLFRATLHTLDLQTLADRGHEVLAGLVVVTVLSQARLEDTADQDLTHPDPDPDHILDP